MVGDPPSDEDEAHLTLDKLGQRMAIRGEASSRICLEIESGDEEDAMAIPLRSRVAMDETVLAATGHRCRSVLCSAYG